MGNKVFKVAVIGCGGIANGKHLPALAKLAAAGKVEVVYFCDIIRERAEKSAENSVLQAQK